MAAYKNPPQMTGESDFTSSLRMALSPNANEGSKAGLARAASLKKVQPNSSGHLASKAEKGLTDQFAQEPLGRAMSFLPG